MLIGNIGIRDGGLIIRDIDDSEIAMPITDALTLLDWLQQHKPELEAEQAKLDDIASNLSAKSVAKSYEEIEIQEYTLYWHPSEMYTARLAYGNDRPLWGSERLEVKQGDRWVPGKAGYLVPGGGLVLFPEKGMSDQEHITLTVGSVVRNVSEPVGDGGGPA